MSQFKALLVALANMELMLWRRFDRPGTDFYTEDAPQIRGRLRAYYGAVGYTDPRLERLVQRAASDRLPWSAAFISYLFQTAGAGPAFPVALSHSVYVTALKGSLSPDTVNHPFQAWPLSALIPGVGDVICTWRDADEDRRGMQRPVIHGRPVSWDAIDANNWQHFNSHCDLICRIAGNNVTAIGGNVRQRVAESQYNTNAAGFLVHPRGVALIKNFR